MLERVCTDFEAQLVEINGEAEHVHLLIHTRRSTRCRAWSTVSKAFPVGSSVSNGLILRNAIGTMSCGRRLSLPPVVVGHRWPSSSNTLSNKRPRFNRPYIPALKDWGFTARLVTIRRSAASGQGLTMPKIDPLGLSDACGCSRYGHLCCLCGRCPRLPSSG